MAGRQRILACLRLTFSAHQSICTRWFIRSVFLAPTARSSVPAARDPEVWSLA